MRNLPVWERAVARWVIALGLLATLHLSACGSDMSGDDDDSDSAGASGDDESFADDDAGDAADDDAGDNDAADDDGPPPVEDDFDPNKRPVVCDGAVWVLNPEADYLSRIDAADLGVTTIEVGRGPTVLRAPSLRSA